MDFRKVQTGKVNFKIYDVKPVQQPITIYILPDISRRKDNQAMKFSQVIEYRNRKLFL